MSDRVERPAPTPASAPILEEESEVVGWIHERANAGGSVPWPEVSAVVHGLRVALRDGRPPVAPSIGLGDLESYTSTHCLNVALLSMRLAEHLGYPEREVCAIGEAGLVHDIGKIRLPAAVLDKTDPLTEEERGLVQTHPIEGARMLMRSEELASLSVVVAYEHHIHWSGGGYPTTPRPRKPHRFSRLVQICDVFDALWSPHPLRPALATEAALDFLGRRAGSQLDPDLSTAFLDLAQACGALPAVRPEDSTPKV